jgi:DNA-binding MarR family transcriptional regulator
MTDPRRAARSLAVPAPTGTAPTSLPAASTSSGDASRLVLDALRAVRRELRLAERAATDGLGLPPAQARVLRVLGERPARSLGELAERTHTGASSASVVVQRLVDEGLVARTPAADDRRRTALALTTAGRGRPRRVPASTEARLREALGVLGHRQAVSLARQLERVVSALQTPSAAEPPAAHRVPRTA